MYYFHLFPSHGAFFDIRRSLTNTIAASPFPNHVEKPTHGSGLLIVQCFFCPLGILAVVARLYVRIAILRRAKFDDWLMLASMIFAVGVSVTVILATEAYGWNAHVWEIQVDQRIKGRQASIAAQTLYLITTVLIKVSILLSYLRIALLDSWFRRLSQASLTFVVVSSVAFFIILWTQCIPIEGYWDRKDERYCLPEGPPVIAQSVVHVMTDLIVYLLPIRTLWKLKLGLYQRIALILVFSGGFVVVVAGCIRAYSTIHLVKDPRDVTWDGFRMWTWTAIEVNLGIICGCAPSIRPLFGGQKRDEPSNDIEMARQTRKLFKDLARASPHKNMLSSYNNSTLGYAPSLKADRSCKDESSGFNERVEEKTLHVEGGPGQLQIPD